MQNHINVLVGGAENCTIGNFNAQRVPIQIPTLDAEGNSTTTTIWVIGNQLPANCVAFYADPLSGVDDGDRPMYVGTPEQGGYWATSKDYPAAFADYTRQLEAQKNSLGWQ